MSHHISYITDRLPTKKESHRLLCIGLDLQIISHILIEAEDAGFVLDIHKNLQTAQEAISSIFYDLYIIDSSIPQEGLVEFIEFIRKQEMKKSTIAVLLDHQEKLIYKLQEKKIIDYIIQKQNVEKEIAFLFKDINERTMKRHFSYEKNDQASFSPSTEQSSSTSLSLAYKPLLFVVDQDPHFLELLEKMKKHFWIKLVVESDPNKAKERLQSQEFTPDGIIVSQTFSSSSLTGLDLLAVLKEKNNCFFPISAILLEKETLDDRLQVIAKEVNYTFSKPVPTSLLLSTMTNAMQINSIPAKVLIIDENINFCHFIAAALEEIGVCSCSTQEPGELYDKLEEFKPNILFLSSSLHKHKALDLVHVLRKDVMYKNIIIALIANGEDIETKMNAYHEGIDYVFFKPIHHKLLQKQLLNIINRRLVTPGLIHNYTGFFELQELQEELTKSVKKSERHNSFLALFQADQLATGTMGYISAKELTVFIDNQLQWEINDHMKYFPSREGQFALIFENADLATVENNLYHFLSDIIKSKQITPLSFSCSIVPINNNFFNGLQVLKEAEKILSDIRKNAHRQEAVIKISCYREEKIEEKEKKEVMIIDSNRDLLKILKRAFESHGIIVNTYDEGGHALQELQTRDEQHLPSLIIAERKLVDMDGMDLCYKLKKLFRKPIPFFILTVFSSDQDIQEGIKSHVLEYIVKPFNISLLIQKALQVIFA